MSKRAIWSLNTQRNELGKATKGQIYLSKIAIGAVVAFLFWLHFGWLFGMHPYYQEWERAGMMFGVWLATYPWSCE